MEEKGQLKYKVGDRVSFEAVISDVDYSRQAPYRFTYRDGSGLWATKEYLEELTDKLPPRPKVTQEVMDWYRKDYPNEEEKSVDEVLDKFANTAPIDSDVPKWLFQSGCSVSELNKRQHALATLIAYGPEAVEVIKEKRYKVRIPNEGMGPDYLVKGSGGQIFLAQKGFFDDLRYELTEEEIKRNHEPLWGTEWVKEVE